jgi:hypothetical protein
VIEITRFSLWHQWTSLVDIILYNKVMNAWRLCELENDDDSISPAEKAQDILDSICDEPELSPNDVTFSIGEFSR